MSQLKRAMSTAKMKHDTSFKGLKRENRQRKYKAATGIVQAFFLNKIAKTQGEKKLKTAKTQAKICSKTQGTGTFPSFPSK